MSRRRYLKIDGTLPDLERPALRHIFTAETRAAAIFVVATAGAAGATSGLSMAFTAAACGIASAAGAQIFTRKFTKGSFDLYFGDANRCYFDCAPDADTPPTRPSFRVATEQIRARGTSTAMLVGILAVPHMAGLLIAAAYFPALAATAVLSAAVTGIFGLSMAANAALMARRFNKVAKGDWVLLNRPPSGKQKPPSGGGIVFSTLPPIPADPLPA